MISATGRLKRIIIGLVLTAFLFQVSCTSSSFPSESKVNQRKINAKREKKEKEGQKQYEKAVKQHYDNQSKTTKAMMKRAKREAKKNTPIK
jgi:hypothetical protein